MWFDGYGWVLFDPTPGRGAPGAEEHTGAAAAQEEGNGTAGSATAEQCPDAHARAPSIHRPRPENGAPTGPTMPGNTVLAQQSDGGSSGGWILVAIILAIAGVGHRHAARAQPLVPAP